MFSGIIHNLRARRARLTLVALLLFVAAQLGQLAHELDTDAHAAGEPCEVCLLAHAKGTPVPADVVFRVPDTRFETPNTPVWRATPAPLLLAYASRAPPRQLPVPIA